MDKKIKNILRKELKLREERVSDLKNYLTVNLQALYMQYITGEQFLENEKDLLELAKEMNVNFKLSNINTSKNGRFAGMPKSYSYTSDMEDNNNFNYIINNSEMNKLKSVKKFIDRKGYDLDLFKYLYRTTKFNKGERVSYRDKQTKKMVKGTITHYYLGNDNNDPSKAFPLKYKIQKDGTNSSTDIYYLNEDLTVL